MILSGTLVVTDRKLIPIDQLRGGEIASRVSVRWHPYECLIIDSGGWPVLLSADHQVFLANGQTVKAENLSEGDQLLVKYPACPSTSCVGDFLGRSFFVENGKTLTRRHKSPPLPSSIAPSDNLFQFLALLYRHGVLHPWSGDIKWHCQEKSTGELISKLLQRIFNCKADIREVKNNITVTANSILLCDFLNNWTSGLTQLPIALCGAAEGFWEVFAHTLFAKASFASPHQQLLCQIRWMMSRLGISTKIDSQTLVRLPGKCLTGNIYEVRRLTLPVMGFSPTVRGERQINVGFQVAA